MSTQMNPNNHLVIMAGGVGSRFWPMSTEECPKQFIDVFGTGRTFIQMTYDRFKGLVAPENVWVVTSQKYADIVAEQLPDMPKGNILQEPCRRNTAPCIAYVSWRIKAKNPKANLVVTPADHLVTDVVEFQRVISSALNFTAETDAIVTLGMHPTRPETGYGYIQVTGGKAGAVSGKPVKVKTFTEKPDKELAKVFFNSGEFFWNSGIFAWKASVILDEMAKYLPDVVSVFNNYDQYAGTPGEKAFLEKAYSECPKISIDYGVMEKTDLAWLYSAHFGWSDVDGWEALFNAVSSKDTEGNATNSSSTLFDGDKDNLVVTENKKKIYAIKGLKDFLVIDTDDALLICPKNDKQFKEFITGLGMPGYEEFR